MDKIKYMFLMIIIIIFYYYFNTSFKNNNKESNINEYLISVIACEMPASYDDEALKAQAVLSRTIYYYVTNIYKRSINNSDQCTIDLNKMKEKWQNNYEKYYKKIKSAVESTNNEVVKKENKLLKTYYFSTSNGYTNSSLSIFNEIGIDSVPSLFDKTSKDYKKEIVYSKEELTKKLGDFNTIEIKKRDSHNNVLLIMVDEKGYTGIDFRKILNLRSTDFSINTNNDLFTFITYGYGHGVGMSQYGASYLAKKGYNYKQIIKYYFGDINIDNY